MTYQQIGVHMAESLNETGGPFSSRIITTILAFLVCVAILIVALSRLLTPSFGYESICIRGLYQQRNDSIQVSCVGASSTAFGFSPMRLYTQLGVSAYNACSGNQPPIASYFLLKDMIESQKNSLSVVIIDATPLVSISKKFNTYVPSEKIAANMPFSQNKVQFLSEISQTYKDFGFYEHLIPVLSYHDRWDALQKEDFRSVFSTHTDERMHGQLFDAILFASNVSLGKSNTYEDSNIWTITDSTDMSSEELQALWNKSSSVYIHKMIDLCHERGIGIFLLKTPASTWTDQMHDSVALFAQKAGIDFLDMNSPSIWKECDLSFNNDYRDSKHMNLRGSIKVTDYIGAYLTQHYEFKTVADIDSVFTQSEITNYEYMIDSSQLLFTNDLVSYLKMINQERYTVLVAVGEQASEVINDEAREELKKIGFRKLASIGPGASYVGIVSNGRLVAEDTAKRGKKAFISGTCEDGKVLVKDTKMQAGASFDHPLMMTGQNLKSAIKVNEKKVSDSAEGIKFVVYDNELGVLVDTSSFDIRATPNRLSDQEPVAQEEQAS